MPQLDLQKLVISAPFGNYLRLKGAASTLVIALLCLCLAACSAQRGTTTVQQDGCTLSTTTFSAMPAKVGGSSVTTVQFVPKPNACSLAHLSTVWYLSQDITVCWDQNGVQDEFDTQTSNAFSIIIAVVTAAGSTAAIVFGAL